ncbi:MAG: helix-turn-helix transcriptional regulator [Pseudonocardiales bacterium]|nr:helix-turn-helix transcriptional regulator [Pseudonocardiales bacterium]MBV9031682.1 helix-turn-helix transcriptional regulator [Pseudonocardiales bacterium]
MNVQTNEPATGDGFEAITTLDGLGRHLRGLREKWHVTQESLSTRTGAVTGRKIPRSRISEIENAKRDWVTERELRAYMRGLKCTPRHIDQVVTVLTQCTATPAKEPPTGPDSGPDAVGSATPDAFPAGSDSADNEPAPREESSDGDPVSLSEPSQRRWRRCRIALAAALAQVVVALAGLGVGLSLRGESGDRPASAGSPTSLLVPHSAPLIAEGAADLVKKDAPFPDGTAVRVDQRSTKTAESRNRPAGRRDAPGGDALQQLTGVMPLAPCGAELTDRRWPGTAPHCRGHALAGPGSPDAHGQDVAVDRRRMGARSDEMRADPLGVLGRNCCVGE